MQNHGTLDIGTAVRLATIIGWTQRGTRVVWLIPDGNGRTDSGTVRSVGDLSGNFLNRTDDVRDGFVRITTTSGWERFVPVTQMVDMVANGTMVAEDVNR